MNNTVKNLKSLIKSTLEGDERLWFVNQDNEQEFNQTLLLDLVEKVDDTIISLLLQEEVLREKFFVKIVPPTPEKQSTYVFKTNEFRFFMEENKVDNSYTNYKNRIGLTDGKKFLKDSSDIVLDWPYKDCVLEGGQSTEEGADIYFEYDTKSTPSGKPDTPQEGNYIKKQGKRKEIFFNQVLAQDEIDRLLDPKALVNWKRFTKDGQIPLLRGGDEVDGVYSLKRNEDGTIAENLIIKGNNLLALHSLKKQFRGKVKLIYIDPPYNTGNDGFKYNDNFNHSTWLTFMKNRLEVARELLRDDGVIFVQCDDNEQAYLKILMDEVFKGNFVNCIIPEMSNLSGNKIEHAIQGRKFPKIKEYILLYAKNRSTLTLNIPKQTKNEWDSEYNIILPHLTEQDFKKIESLIIENNQDKLNEVLKTQKIESLNDYLKKNNIEDTEEWKKQNAFRILASKPNTALRKKALELDFGMLITSIRNSRGDLKIIRTDFNKETETARIELVFAKNNLEIFLGDIWHGITTTGGVAQEGGVVLKNGKKPEQLLEIILKSATQPNDIVLDYHLGSGTTCAVAHKMGRQYIGIEQMDYIETIAVERLKKVIGQSTSPAKAGTPQEENIPLVEGWTAKQDGVDSFDTGGISKAVNWQGGGDFVYLELAKWNERAKEIIQSAESLEEMIGFLDELSDKYFLNYNLKMQEFREKIILDPEFQSLSLESQKAIFMAMLDNNQMYVNKSEMADEKFGISEEEQKLTEEFYK